MQRLDGTLVHSATDLNDYAECLHLITLERAAAAGMLVAPAAVEDGTAELLRRKGAEHEQRYLATLRRRHGDGLVEFRGYVPRTRDAYLDADRATFAAMAMGAPAIAQATFFDGTFLGRADVLRRVERPSSRWPWSYEALDTKLALSTKPHFLVQLCQYSDHLERLQGVAPHDAAIVLGSGEERSYRVEAYAPYYRRLRAAYLASIAGGEDAYPLEIAHCSSCTWSEACAGRRERDDHLSLVAGMRRDHALRLEGAGIATLAALAVAGDAERPKRIGAATFANLRAQAAEQHRYRAARARGPATHSFTLRPLEAGAGLSRLPEPRPGDIFFDMEGDPLYRPGMPLEYLFGIYLPDEAPRDRYVAFWGTDPQAERAAFEAFVDFVTARRARHPDLHVYHYAPYEPSALARLSTRFGSREAEVDAFLQQQLFVDLFPIVRQAMWISQPSYSIKRVEALYGYARTTQTRAGDDSIVMFESWLESRDPRVLEDIRAYNEDDCTSTFRLRDWLVARRAEYNAATPEPIPWRGPPAAPKPTDDPAAAERDALSETLLAGLGTPASETDLRAWPEGARGRWLLGHLLAYHRRESKSEWWEFFRRLEHPTDLLDDRQSLGGLELVRDVAPYRVGSGKLLVYTFAFPEQEFELSGKPVDVDTGKSAGDVLRIDDAAQRITIKLAGASDPATLRGLIPGGPMPTEAQRRQLHAIAATYLSGTLRAQTPATEALLLRRPPRLEGRAERARVQPDTVTPASVSAVIRALRDGALVVQGPPGTGKTTAGATAIVDLLGAGKRVAVAALSHKALHNLCHKIEAVAAERGVAYAGAHKAAEASDTAFRSRAASPWIGTAEAPIASYDLASVTAYAWALALDKDASLAGAFDVLVIDEAGQVSLADALILSRLARAVVLLGDPQQLPQVSKGAHPLGAGASVLEHLLGEDATIPEDRGVFLDRSYRLEPRIADFVSTSFYDGRLRAASRNANNRVDSRGLSGGGTRFAAVAHETNARRSPEEAHRLADEIARLLDGGTTTLRGGLRRPLAQADVLVVTPYNAQRVEIARLLGERGLGDVAVGTVDKFQGQEAPVVFYSLATSSAELAPRGLEFLLSPNRFNVAVSRAEALAFVAASPTLLASRATSIESMRLLALLCGYVELAAAARPSPPEAMPLPFG